MTVEKMAQFTIFEGLTPEESGTILQCCEMTTARKGQQVIKAGEFADSLFLVLSGRIEVRFKVEHLYASVEIPLDIIRRGEVCGWSALIPPHKYTLNAYATEDSEFLRIERADLQYCCEADTRLGYVVMRNIAQILGNRYELARQMLIGGIQKDLKKRESKFI